MLGQNGEFDLAPPDEENRVGDIALAEYFLVFEVSLDGSASALLAQKNQGIKRVLGLRGLGARHVLVVLAREHNTLGPPARPQRAAVK
jgi:hypothetical protein